MKKIITLLGYTFLVILVLVAAASGGLWFAGNKLDKESKAYVDAAVPAIAGNWSVEELRKRASEEFSAAVDYDEIGIWSEVKLAIIREYASAYSTILEAQRRNKIPGLKWLYIGLGVKPGAFEKRVGRAFIYFNRVVKFREIAMRGPWTSGGIEFNFGDIGHAPTTATPVDYVTRQNPDGSVSCIVGALDLASRTEWRVEIRLPADRALFETRSFWYNPTVLPTSLYHWMNAAAEADSMARSRSPAGSPSPEPAGPAEATSTAFTTRDSHRGRNSKFFMWVNSSRIAGSSVMASTAATIIAKFFV